MVTELIGVNDLAKRCEGAATLYCRPDSAFLCLPCDARIHSPPTRQDRVWLCDQAPAAVTCKADADIHSANPLARRHDRVPVGPFSDSAESPVKSSALNLFVVPSDTYSDHCSDEVDPGPMFFPQMEEPFVNFNYTKSAGSRLEHDYPVTGADGVVPVQTKQLGASVNCFNMDLSRSKLCSISQTVSSTCLDVGVVPDGVYSLAIVGAPQTQLSGMEREARVMRYREKRKKRKFEKTIRYASRKAYAETRPRIKGRFAKLIESGRLYGSQYGVVPSF